MFRLLISKPTIFEIIHIGLLRNSSGVLWLMTTLSITCQQTLEISPHNRQIHHEVTTNKFNNPHVIFLFFHTSLLNIFIGKDGFRSQITYLIYFYTLIIIISLFWFYVRIYFLIALAEVLLSYAKSTTRMRSRRASFYKSKYFYWNLNPTGTL